MHKKKAGEGGLGWMVLVLSWVWGVGVGVEGVCLLVVLIGRLGRHGAGLVGVLNEVPAAVGHEFGPPAVQCKSKAPPDLLEEDLIEHQVVDVEELFFTCSYMSWAVFTWFGKKSGRPIFRVFFKHVCARYSRYHDHMSRIISRL